MIIEWKGMSGYGDMISPLCYAQNMHEITGEKVTIIFFWSFPKDDLPETPDKRAQYIYDYMKLSGVKIKHRYERALPYKHTNYDIKIMDPQQILHNIYFPEVKVDPVDTLVCSPIRNQKSLAEIGKSFKDGLDKEEWEELERKYKIVDYRTPIDEAFKSFEKCKYFIGYQGSCAWIARLFGVPMTIHTATKKLAYWQFPWCDGSFWSLDEIKSDRDEYIKDLRRARSERAASI